MSHAKEIDAFVHQSFELYRLDFKQFFNDLVDEDEDDDGFSTGGHLEELPLVVGDNLDMALLSQAAKALGVSTDALLNMDKDAILCWYKRYPYFELREEFEQARQHSFKYGSSPEFMSLAAIFNEDYNPDSFKRYKGDVKHRLLELLKSNNAVMPGCYHEGSDITHLTIVTDNFTHFEQIADLSNSYLSMVSRARDLFYRLWDSELNEEEINEYNFLVSVLGMRDVGYAPTKPIYYDIARRFAPIYKQEGYSDYSSYIMYRGADFPPFYTCKEFYDDLTLVEKLVQEFPHMKSEIGRTAMLAKNFLCFFTWSDEPEPPVDAAFDEYLRGTLRDFDEDVPSWYHQLYVPKTEEEIGSDINCVRMCNKLASPSSKGGLKLPIPECQRGSVEAVKRITSRIVLLGGAYDG